MSTTAFKSIVLGCLAVLCSGANLASSQKFSELIPGIAEAENATLYHRLYIDIALGVLPVEKYKVLIQQDDIYVVNYLKFFGSLARQEADPERRAYLESLENEADFWEVHFDEYFKMYEFNRTEYVSPPTAAYNRLHNDAAQFGHISEALAAAVPCFTIWHKMGFIWARIADLPSNPDHPYRHWIENNTPVDDSIVDRFLNFVDGYYDRLGNNTFAKQIMLDAYRRGVEAELYFAEGNYQIAFEEKFSVMAGSLVPEIMREVVHHPLYINLAKDTLNLARFQTLIQQDDLYMRGFYRVFELLAAKEEDPELKAKLTKNNASMVEFLQYHYDRFGFEATDVALPTTLEYVNFILDHAGGNKSVALGLASIYGCYTVWYKMGIVVGKVADFVQNPAHRFRYFIEYNDPIGSESTSLARMSGLIDGYYERLGSNVAVKRQMFEAYAMGVQHEFNFANGNHGMY